MWIINWLLCQRSSDFVTMQSSHLLIFKSITRFWTWPMTSVKSKPWPVITENTLTESWQWWRCWARTASCAGRWRKSCRRWRIIPRMRYPIFRTTSTESRTDWIQRETAASRCAQSCRVKSVFWGMMSGGAPTNARATRTWPQVRSVFCFF